MITEENNYYSKIQISSIKDYNDCITKYSEKFNDVIKLETDLPIFFDTNLLLRYYSISFNARVKLFEFIKKNSSRIFLTNQVQKEFLKNREDVIKRFFEQVTNKIPKDFNSEIVNKLKNFIEQHKIILKDYPYVEEGIENHKLKLEKILQQLNLDSENKQKEYKDLIWKDDFLELLNSCNQIDNLTDAELNLVITKFDLLKKNISKDNLDSVLNKPNSVFPGLCDIKEKPENPYGDFIIYHEMMKFILEKNTDVIFLTFDNSKGDWMTKSKSPHIHYIQNMYSNTNKILYILDAERTLENILNVDIDSLVKNNSQNPIQNIDIENLSELINHHSIFIGSNIVPITQNIIDELKLNGYNSIQEIESVLDIVTESIKEFRKENPKYNSTGILRFAMRIGDTNYLNAINISGKTIERETKHWAFLKKYRDLI